MAQYNSLAPLTDASLKDLLNTIGITQFIDETNWFQIIGGLIVQGGFIDDATTGDTITLNTSFTRQILGVFLIPVRAGTIEFCVNTVTVDDFVVVHNSGGTADFYWFAIGV